MINIIYKQKKKEKTVHIVVKQLTYQDRDIETNVNWQSDKEINRQIEVQAKWAPITINIIYHNRSSLFKEKDIQGKNCKRKRSARNRAISFYIFTCKTVLLSFRQEFKKMLHIGLEWGYAWKSEEN